HEFDAKTRATAYDRWKLDESDLKGDTWIGEAGLTFKPTKTTTIDLSVQGFTGQREGGAGSVEVNWAF
ncbi:MAG: hypothetical protein LBL69_03305, partial [Zoogloeaceae bacterium]|nr:hypothetical protein [Zoogloeaceae bacterium]